MSHEVKKYCISCQVCVLLEINYTLVIIIYLSIYLSYIHTARLSSLYFSSENHLPNPGRSPRSLSTVSLQQKKRKKEKEKTGPASCGLVFSPCLISIRQPTPPHGHCVFGDVPGLFATALFFPPLPPSPP